MGVKTGQVVRPDPNVTYASAWPLPYIYASAHNHMLFTKP